MSVSLRRPLHCYETNKMQPEDVIRGRQVRNDLKRLLCLRFPMVDVLLHGSCQSKVGLRNCDVDITIVGALSISLHEIASEVRSSSAFEIEEEIYGARVPILILRHVATGSEVDVCLRRRSSVVMAHVMKELARLNPMLAPMIVVLKKWAKGEGLISPRNGYFSCFVVTVMAIFHQQARAGMTALAPSPYASEEDVRNLARRCQPLRCSVNDSTLRAQLRDFFEFYGNFDFRSNVIDIRSGQSQSRVRTLMIADPMAILHPIEGQDSGNCVLFVSSNALSMARRAFHREAAQLRPCGYLAGTLL